MKTIKGNIATLAHDMHFDVITHGCNCFCTMNSGVAKALRAVFPEIYEEDCAKTIKGDRNKLGTILPVKIDRGATRVTIVNSYTQYDYGYDGTRRVDYDAIRSCFKSIAAMFPHQTIAYPKIGAGLAGGDWNIISEIIDRELHNHNHTLVVFE